MIYPKIDALLEQVDSKYGLVLAAAKRARQINEYHHQLGEGGLDDYAPPLVESRSKNFLTMAFEEIADRKLLVSYPQRRAVRGPRAKGEVPAEAGPAA
jgi:DNA-directed RNA polymerase subunit omega